MFLKFRYFEKATKIWKKYPTIKIIFFWKWDISSNFVAFLQYLAWTASIGKLYVGNKLRKQSMKTKATAQA